MEEGDIEVVRKGMDETRGVLVSRGERENLPDKCRQACILTLLALKEIGIFEHLILLESFSNREEKFVRNPGWTYHDVFLAGKEGKWVAGALADSEKGRELLIGPGDLGEVVRELTEVEGGTWPDARSVMKLVKGGETKIGFNGNDGRYSLPTLIYDNSRVFPWLTLVRPQGDQLLVGGYLD